MSFSGAWAATPAAGAYPEESKTYYLYAIQSDGSRSYLYNDEGTLKVSNGSKEDANKYKWTVTKTGSNYYVQNVAGKYLSSANWSLSLKDESYAFDLSQTVSDAACVTLYVNDPTYGATFFVAPKASGAFANNLYFTSSGSNSDYSSSFVFEEVLPAHSLTNGAYYRIYCDNNSKQYLYDDSGLKVANTSSLANSYVWKCIVSAEKYNFQNVGTNNYLSHNAVQAEAYNFTITSTGTYIYHDGCVTIKSDAASKYMGRAAGGGTSQADTPNYDKVTTDYSFNWRFVPLKVVTFTTAVAVNGGDAVSTLYVATDGSDSFTLPEGYLYSVNGATEVSNTLAASAIAAAGTSNITVTVNAEAKNAKARINNNKFYHIYTYNNGTTDGTTKYYLTATGYLTTNEASAADFLFTATSENQYINAGYAWMITADNGTKYFTNSDTSKDNHIHTTTNKRQNWEAQVFYWNGSKYAVRATNSTNGSGWRCEEFWTVKADATSDDIPEADYDATTNTKHYVWEIEETGTVTYNLVFQGETLRTTYKNRADVLGDATLPESTWNHDCCAYSYSPATITGETETVNVTMTWNRGSLTFSSNYASATWYHMSLRDKWAKYDASVNGSQGHPLYASADNVNYDVAGFTGMWAFVGNPLDGAYVINRAAGEGKVLGWTTPPRMQGTSEGSSKKFVLSANSSGATKFSLNYSTYYINDKDEGNKLVFWNSNDAANKAGSAIAVEPISLYEQSLIELDDYAAEHAEGEYFGLKSSAVESLRSSIKTAKASYNSAAYDATHDAIEALWPGTDNANVITPDAGDYRIISYSGRKIVYNNGALTTTTTENLIETVIKLAGTYPDFHMSVQGQNVQNFTTYSQQATTTSSSGSTLTLAPVLTKPGYCTIKNETTDGTYPGYSYFHKNGSDNVVSWEKNADNSHWKLVDAGGTTISQTLNAGGDGNYYATLYLPFDVTIAGATAYTLTDNGTYLSATEVVDNKVPAGTPVLLKGDAATATATINSGDAFASIDRGSLQGTYVDLNVSDINDKAYFLGKVGSDVGFYHWEGTTLGANKAYLPASGGSGSNGFKLIFAEDDDVTAVAPVNGQSSMVNGQSYYDLQGRKVKNPQKGNIYILNGKKVLF